MLGDDGDRALGVATRALARAVTRDAFPEVLVGKQALAKASVNLSEAARILGVSRSTLYRMIERTRNAWPQALTVRFIC